MTILWDTKVNFGIKLLQKKKTKSEYVVVNKINSFFEEEDKKCQYERED